MAIDTDDLQYVRFLVSDVDQDAQVFTDAEVQMVIAREGGVKIAAAVLMERIADNEALRLKVITSQGLSVDGAKLADSLRKSAERLRADHAESLASAGDSDPIIVEYVPWGFSLSPELAP